MKTKILSSLSTTLLILLSILNTQAVLGQSITDVSHEDALKVVLAAKKEAEKLDVLVNIAIVDVGANLKAFIRMDDSFLGSIDVAIKKAKTSRYFDMDTGDLGKLTQPGGIIYNIELSNDGLISFPGGIPLKNENGKIIGAIGVSGGTIEQDHEIAIAGMRALLR